MTASNTVLRSVRHVLNLLEVRRLGGHGLTDRPADELPDDHEADCDQADRSATAVRHVPTLVESDARSPEQEGQHRDRRQGEEQRENEADNAAARKHVHSESEAQRKRRDGRKRVGALDGVAVARRVGDAEVEDRSRRCDRRQRGDETGDVFPRSRRSRVRARRRVPRARSQSEGARAGSAARATRRSRRFGRPGPGPHAQMPK